MKLMTLRDLLIDQLKDLHNAEAQLVKALPKVAKAATSDELREAILSHLEETRGQMDRLDQIFEMLDVKPGRKKCKAMEGLLAEGSEIVAEDAEPMVHDAAIIAAAQRIEHYEIAAYGCSRTFATNLGEHAVADLLQQTLDEEAAADEALTQIAVSGINKAAAELETSSHRE